MAANGKIEVGSVAVAGHAASCRTGTTSERTKAIQVSGFRVFFKQGVNRLVECAGAVVGDLKKAQKTKRKAENEKRKGISAFSVYPLSRFHHGGLPVCDLCAGEFEAADKLAGGRNLLCL